MNAINKVYHSPVFENKKILCAIVDQQNLRNKHPALFERMKEISYVLTVRRTAIFPCQVKFFNTIDDATLYGAQFDLLIIQNVGNLLTHNTIFEYIDSYWKSNLDFFMIAFTLDWDSEHGEGWFECHHQMLIINPKKWISLGAPKFGNWETVHDNVPNHTRSEENFHDKYTPYWIEGKPGTTVKKRTKQGWNLIKVGLEAGCKIDNFSTEMRNCRTYLYPESNSNEFYNSISSHDTTSLTNPNQILWIKRQSNRPKIWIFNSEIYHFNVEIDYCDTYFGPAAGFKYLNMLNVNQSMKFVIYDFNQSSLDWIKELKENWDGENLTEYLLSKPQEIQDQYQYVFSSIPENEDILYDGFGGKDKFKELWTKFKTSDVTFNQCNLLDENQVKLLIRENLTGKGFFYFSNIFATDPLIYTIPFKKIQDSFQKFNNILKLFSPIQLHGTDPLGHWINTRL